MQSDWDIDEEETDSQAEWDARLSDEPEIGSHSTSSRRSGSEGINGSILPILNSLFAMQSGGGPGQRSINLRALSPHDLTRLLQNVTSSGYNLFGDEEEDEHEEYYEEEERGSTPDSQLWYPPHKEPQSAGLELLASGDFGRVSAKDRVVTSNINIAKRLLTRVSAPPTHLYKEDIMHNLVPNTSGASVASFGANVYTGQYSADSSFYYTCSQDFRLHIFDTTQPPHSRLMDSSGISTTMPIKKSIQGRHGRWTITDANLSPDNERLIYSSITSIAYMTSISDSSMHQIPIPFSDRGSRDDFGIWSCRFSADGNEVVAGGAGHIFVYDLIANRRSVKIKAHDDDINSCCWADTASGNVLISASDDTFLKVWDRRSLGSSPKPSGVLIGHTEGLTYVSAKGDGRYVISNGKDQAMRLWDLRKMRSNQDYESVSNEFYGIHNFDYRYPTYRKPRHSAHPLDCSVMTYRGHSVLRTLIRCHFSPAETTGSQYLYSGSADGRIHIWSLDGTIVQVLDRAKTMAMSWEPSGPEPGIRRGGRTGVCVRDVSWHSQEPVLMSAAWEGRYDGSIVARHEWKGLIKRPGALEDWTEKTRLEREECSRRRQSGRRVPGAFTDDDEEDN